MTKPETGGVRISPAVHATLAILGLAAVAVLVAVGLTTTIDGAWLQVLVGAAATIVGTAHGSSTVVTVFRVADPPHRRTLDRLGTPAAHATADLAPPAGTMRGGAMIGVLERAATIVALACAQPGVIAAIVAVKAIGRFGELDGPVMRERFLVGSLASLAVAAGWGLAARLLIS